MVFESIVVDILNKFLGSYIQNLDSSQLKLGIWGGDVTLKNLIFKENALDDLHMPVKAAYGQLEKLTLNIPWKNIYNAPVKVAIDGLNLLIVPKSVVKYDADKEEKLLWDTKQQQLKRLEEAKRIEEESKKPRDPQQDSFTEKLVAQIIKNLQIRISNIHVRYEDKRSNPGSPFAFGITLHNLFFESADENWKTGIFQDSSKIIFKVVTLNSFAVYWNSKSKLYLSMQDNEKMSAFKNGIATKNSTPPNTIYILGPLNSTLKLQLNPKPEQDGSNYSIPKIMVIFIMEELGIGITKHQYQDILILTQSLEWMEISAQYRKYRPNVPYKGHAKEWWMFAHKCVLYEDVKRRAQNWSWKHMKEHRNKCRLYKDLYRQKLYGKKLANEAQYQELEKDLDIFNIALIRKQADMEFEKSGGKKEEKKSAGWFGGWFGGKESKKEDTSIVKQFEEAMTAEEKAKLFDAIGYQDNVVAAVYPKEFIENKFIFELKNLHVAILNDFSKPALEVIQLSLKNVISSVEQRPSAQAVKILAKVESLTVNGIKRHGVPPPTLISTHNTEKDKKYSLLDVLFETNPLDGNCDQRLHITSRPLQIVYNAETINEMATVFKPPQSVEIYSKLQSAATETLAGIKEVSTASFQYAIEHHKYLDLNLDLKAPFVIVPESGVMKKDVPLLLLDMGNLKMQSVKRDQNAAYIPTLHKQGLTQDEITKEMISQAYDKYTIKLVGIQVLLANPGDDWMDARSKPTSNLHIWQPTNMKITLEKSVILDDPRIPQVKIHGSLPIVHFSLSDVKLLQLAKLAFSIPIPQDEPEDFIQPTNIKPNKLESQLAVHDIKKVTVPVTKAPEEPPPEVQLTNLDFSFELGEVQLTILEEKDKVEKEFLKFCISRLGISMLNKTFSMAVDVYLGDIDCHNMMFQTPDGKPVHLIETGLKEKAAAKLLSIHYLKADKKAPSFNTLYNSTLQLIEVDFATLKAILHQEALLSIMQFSNTLMAEIDRIKSASQPESVQAVVTMTKRASMTSLNSAFGDLKQQVSAGHGKKRKRKASVEVIDLKVVAKMGQLSVEICNIIKSIVAVNISGLEASVIMQKEKMSISNVLRKIEVLDPTPKAIYPQIVSFVGNDVFDTTIVIYNSATEGSGYLDMSKVDTSVSASIGCIRIIFLNKFVTDCLNFLNNFQAATARIKEATVKAAEAAMENVTSVYQKASRIRLNINMKAPVILMPRNSTAVEVMLLDMGRIKIGNKFTVGVSTTFSSPTPPILEHMHIELQKFKLTRAVINPSTHTEIADCPLLEPTSFLIKISRNLSASWCKDIPEMDISGNFKAISLSMSQEDYGMLMRVLNENLSETSPESKQLQPTPASPEPIRVQAVQHVESQKLAPVGEVEVEEEEENIDQNAVFTRYKFNFILDSISASLYFGKSDLKKGTVVRQPSAALTYFEIHVIAAKGEMLTDGSLWTNVVIVNCFMDDVRSTTETCFPRMLDKKSQDDKDSMIDVTFRKDAHNDTFVDVKVRSFNLVACPNYLVTIAIFFTKDITDVSPPPTSVVPETQQRQIAATPTPSTKAIMEKEEPEPAKGTFTLVLFVEQPDIILVEDETNIDTEAIILNNTISFKMKSTPESVTMSGTISDLQLVSCCYNPELRESSKTEILSPCDISLSSTTPAGEGMHTDIDISDLEIHMAPSTVRLLTSVASKFSTVEDKGEQEEEGEKDYSDLWVVQNITDFKFWFLKPDEAVEAVETEPVEQAPEKPRKEQLIIKARTILLTMEIGLGNQAVPMLLLEAGFFADIQNWSSALEIAGGLTMEMLSYNEKLALWEPFIERIDSPKGSSRPWELTLELKTSSTPSQNVDLFEQDLEEVTFEQPKLSLVIMANDVMDVCFTKTSIDVLINIGQAFSDAVHMVPCGEKEIRSPFLIRNDTGIPITLLLKAQDFLDEGWEWMLILIPDPKDPTKQLPEEQSQNISEVILEHDTSVPLTVKTNPSKVSVSKKSVLKLQDMTSDKKLLIKIVEMNASRHISVKRADKRFFQLPRKTYPGDQWGIVSDVTAVYGCKIITLRSVLQIKNHLKIPIEAYYMAPESEELKCCGEIDPGQTFNVPLHAVYTTTSEIFFRPVVGDYTFSSTSYIWKDLIKNPTLYKHVECSSRQSGEKPFLLTVIGEIDQIFFEDSRKKTLASTCYILNLKPTAVLTNLLPVAISCSDQNESNEQIAEGGESMELSWAEINVSLIVVKLKNYLGKVWTCSKKLSSTAGELSVWSFETDETPKLTMDLGMYMENDHDSLSLSLYCPFWMINKTGALLSYRADDIHNVIIHPPDVEGPILFSFRAKNFFARKKAALMIKDSEWSDKFSIDVVGSSGTVKCPSKDGISYEVGVQIRLAKVKLTKIIIFMPFYLIVNNCKFDVEFLENDSNNWITLPYGECMPFWPQQSRVHELKVKAKEYPQQSKSFSFTDPITVLLRLDNKIGGIQADCQVNEASTIITFSEYRDGSATVRLVNCLETFVINYHQSGEKDDHILKPQETALYTWSNPSGKSELVWSIKGTKEIRNDLIKDSIGEMALEGENPTYWVLFLDNTQRTLLFTDDIVIATRSQCAGEFERADQDITVSLKGFGLSLVDNINKFEVIYLSISSTGIIWEACKEKSRRYKPLTAAACSIIEDAHQQYLDEVRLGKTPESRMVLQQKIEVDFQTYMMLKPSKRKIRRSFQTGMWLNYKTSPHRVQLHAKINRLQIDNQMPDCVFPVILAPVPPPKTVAADSEPKPFAEVSIMMRKSDFSSLRQYKYFKILIQEFHIKVDQAFLNGIMAMFAAEAAEEETHIMFDSDLESTNIDLKDVAEIQSSQDPQNFYNLLHFSPLKVHISFSMQGFGSSDSSKTVPLSSNFVNVFVQSVGVTLTEIQDVVFKLAYFERQNKFISQRQLTKEVITHYSGQAIKQMYVLVLGLDVIGNPFGLVIGLTRGVEDLFYEPIQGAIQGPEEFAEGLALGVKSLFGHAVGGAAGAVSRITGTLGKGVAALTLDEDYQKRRREAQLHRSANFQENMAQSGKGLVMGVFDGVTGVFVKPIEGAKQQGVEGFFKGMGKGVVGLVTRPTAGVIDFASGTFDSVKRIAENTNEIQRVRAPRYFQPDGVVRPYNQHEAEGYKLLQDVEKGKFASTDHYVAHAPLPPDGRHVVLVTDKRVILVTKGDIFGQWIADWQVTWDEMKTSPTTSDKGVVITLKEARKKKLGLFGSGESTRTIHCKNLQLSQWIVGKINEAMEKQQ